MITELHTGRAARPAARVAACATAAFLFAAIAFALLVLDVGGAGAIPRSKAFAAEAAESVETAPEAGSAEAVDAEADPAAAGDPDAAEAAPTEDEGDGNAKVLEINNQNQFVNAFRNGGSYKLMCDITFTKDDIANLKSKGGFHSQAALSTKKNLNIDMNDKTVYVGELSGHYFIYVEEGGSLTIGHSYSAAPQLGGFKSTTRTDETTSRYKTWNTGPLFGVAENATLTLSHRVMDFDFREDSRHSYTAAVVMSWGTLNIADGAAILNCNTLVGSSMVENCKGTATLRNCQITGCAAQHEGSMLKNGSGCTMDMGEGACIANCTTRYDSIVNNTGTFRFCGAIEGCSALWGPHSFSPHSPSSSMVSVGGGGKLYITGGTMRNNHSARQGGTVQVGWDYDTSSHATAYCEMSGGVIGESNANDRGLGNVVVYYGTFKMTGGTIEGSSKATQGPCVDITENGKAELAGGTLKGCRDGKPYRGGTVCNKGRLTVSGATLDANGCEAQCGGLVYQTGSSAKTIFSSGTMKGGGAYGDALGNKGYGGGIYVEGGSLRMGGTDKQAVISDCMTSDKGGGVYCKGSAVFVMNRNALIVNCGAGDAKSPDSAMPEGGGVYVEDCALEMNDGATIENCTAKAYGGGVSCNANRSRLDCNGGSAIRNCSSESFGGAAYARQGRINVEEGAAVTGCKAKHGGAFALEGTDAELRIRTAVSGNSASEHGGGAIVLGAAAEEDAPKVVFLGAGSLSGNTSDSNGGSGLYLDYLRSTDPNAATRIAPATTSAGCITVEAANTAAAAATPVLCEKNALGTADTSVSRLLFKKCTDALKGKFTFEDARVGYLALGTGGTDLHIWKAGKRGTEEPDGSDGTGGGAADGAGGAGGSAADGAVSAGARILPASGDPLACLRFLIAPLFGAFGA